ncbi:MAG: elongation factor G [Candidatus Omnitrophica bacterium]|nr:elongation factor G [Candidatus Omnitrophota bacterium]MDD5429988.1 elongation factor G [Candidatus Omnitrophota bacterium]
MNSDVARKKTFLLCGHAQSGKTSLTEAILFKCKAISRLGRVDDETSTSDYEDDEKERKSSINLSVLNCTWRRDFLQFIDVPGYLDFVGEIVAGSRAADFAVIVVDAVEGVGVGTEKAWDILRKENIPCLFFINKLDKENVDFQGIVQDIKESLTKKIVVLGYENNSERINLLHDKDKNVSLYNEMVEAIAESDDKLLEKYLETGKIEEKEVNPALKKAVMNCQVFPVIGGVAVSEKGIETLLELIEEIMPSVGEAIPRNSEDISGKKVIIEAKVQDPFCAQVFKTMVDPFVGQLTIFRVFSGTLNSNTEFFNVSKDTKEKFGQLYFLQGKQQIAQEAVCAGDIAAVAKLKDAQSQDTLCAASRPVLFKALEFPAPAYSASVKPKTRQDEDKISSALARLTSEDLTCHTSRDAQTKELIISGMGELHIHVIIERMKRKYHADVELGTPKVPYFETITKSVEVSHKYKKQTGGRGQYGDVSIKVSPLARGKKFEFVNKIVGGAIPRNFIPSVEKGIKNAMKQGFLAGYPITDIQVSLFDGSYHPVDSSDMAFQIAASMALKKAFDQAGSIFLEPIMNVEIVSPGEFMGQITGDINSRRGKIMGMEIKGKNEVVKAQVPLAEMFKYTSDLRSVTGGRGSYSMSFAHYEAVPSRIAQGIIEESKKIKQAEHV